MAKDKKLQHEIDTHHFRVAIFGSARIKKGHSVYKRVYKLAHKIAEEDIDVVTGGGPGLMEAASAGHRAGRKKSGVHSVGLNIMLPKEQYSNKHLDLKKDFERFSDRLDYFMVLSNAVVVAPGGIGTLLELFYTWQLVQVNHICNIPIILLGREWPDLIKYIEKWPLKHKFIDKADLSGLFIAHTPEDAMKVIRMAHESFKNNGKFVCLNYKKYKI
jgi:uncharacterized protein (TIGR00730 family)